MARARAGAACGAGSRWSRRGAVALGILAALWQLVAVHNPDAFPTLGAVYTELTGNLSMYGIDSAVTLREVAIGLAASFAVAFPLAVVMTHVKVVERGVMPIAVILNVTPVVALTPGLTLLLGIGLAPRYVVTALIVFFPLLINSLVGLGSIDSEALDLFHTLHASRLEVLLRLRLPSSLPFLIVAARIASRWRRWAPSSPSSRPPGRGTASDTRSPSPSRAPMSPPSTPRSLPGGDRPGADRARLAPRTEAARRLSARPAGRLTGAATE